MLMTKFQKRKPSLYQPSLFDEEQNRPTWSDLPSHIQERVNDLVAQILAESLRARKFTIDRKEVVNER